MVSVDSVNLLFCTIDIDHDTKSGDREYKSSHSNFIILPILLETSGQGDPVDVTESITEVKWYLNRVEYGTLPVGEPGEFDWLDCGSGTVLITIEVKLPEGGYLIYTYNIDIWIVVPK